MGTCASIAWPRRALNGFRYGLEPRPGKEVATTTVLEILLVDGSNIPILWVSQSDAESADGILNWRKAQC